MATLYQKEVSGGVTSLAVNTDAKMQLAARTSEMMPGGTPDWKGLRLCAPLAHLIPKVGQVNMLKALTMLIRDFCSAFNVVRNMSEDQVIDAAAMLMDECGDFRLEDYLMMFSMAKRGTLRINDGRGIMDRIDLETIGKIVDAYWQQRYAAGQRVQEQEHQEYENHLAGLQFTAPAQEAMTAWRKETEAVIAASQQAKDKQMRERRDESIAGFIGLYVIPTLARRILAGEKLREGDEKDFYQAHRERIDEEVKRLRELKEQYPH